MSSTQSVAGHPVAVPLSIPMAHGTEPAFAGNLLSRHGLASEAPSQVATVASGLLDPLTERELEVLHLLPTHLSSTEIAERLIVSANTIRTHIKNIYSKLGVHSRDEAVLRARDLGLL